MDLITADNKITMTLKEITDLIGVRHNESMEKVEKLQQECGFGVLRKTRITSSDRGGRPTDTFILNKKQAIAAAARLNNSALMMVVNRLEELEQQHQFQIPKTLSQALMLAARQAEQIEQQQLLIEQQKPAVDFVDKYVESHTTKGIREVAKILGQKEKEFVNKLIEKGILFRQGGALLPYANYHHEGYFEVKTGEKHGHAFHQARFTPSGIAWIVNKLGL